MIDWLEIKQFAIADHLELEFENGFTTVTGETGAGKSIIVDAIAILLGARSDSSYIQHHQDTAELQAGFRLSTGHPALDWLQNNEMDNDNECILRRVLRRDKPSKGYINGRAATASQLKTIGQELVDIHGQNEHHSLLLKQIQLELLDSAAENRELVGELAECYTEITDIQKQIDMVNDQSHTNQERADLLKFQIGELSELDPKPGEWASLSAQQKRLGHQQELIAGTQKVAEALYDNDDENLSRSLLQFSNELEQLSEYENQLKPIAKMLGEAQINIEEAANQLRPFYKESSLNPEEIAIIESRCSLYYSLARKHRLPPESLTDHLESIKQELTGLSDPEGELKRLNALFDAAFQRYSALASKVSQNRDKTSRRLSKEVTSLIQKLGMQSGEFCVQLTAVEPGRVTRFGNESAAFLVSANAGYPPAPLGKVASGGELSRISLAIQVVLASKAKVSSMIFDEVDVGIGGEVANVVGQSLRDLGKSGQVICITHLSQVAAKGDHHFKVSKQGDQGIRVLIDRLTTEQRTEEIARMSGGENITKQSLAHAQQMLKSA